MHKKQRSSQNKKYPSTGGCLNTARAGGLSRHNRDSSDNE